MLPAGFIQDNWSRYMHPSLYKALLTIALTFIFLAGLVLPFQRTGSAEFVVSIFSIILLLIFIILITIEYRIQMKAALSVRE